MGAWGYELNQSDAALDVVGTAIGIVLEEIEGLVTEAPSRSSALRLAGCLGCVALLDPDDLDPGAALVDADDFGRSPAGRIRAAVTRHRRALSKAVPALAPFASEVLAASPPVAPRLKKNGTVTLEMRTGSIDEEAAREIAARALAPSGARKLAQQVLDRVVDETSPDVLTDLAGILHVAVTLRPWTKTTLVSRKRWRELCVDAVENGDDFERALGRSCKRALRKLRPSPK
jgi:hypothetical protein